MTVEGKVESKTPSAPVNSPKQEEERSSQSDPVETSFIVREVSAQTEDVFR